MKECHRYHHLEPALERFDISKKIIKKSFTKEQFYCIIINMKGKGNMEAIDDFLWFSEPQLSTGICLVLQSDRNLPSEGYTIPKRISDEKTRLPVSFRLLHRLEADDRSTFPQLNENANGISSQFALKGLVENPVDLVGSASFSRN